jgi:hypothetical protein
VRPAAVAAPAPAPTTPPTTAAPAPSSTTTSLVVAPPEWPQAALKTERAASHSAAVKSMPLIAAIAAVLLMLVAGVEVHTLRRRASFTVR